ncbi:helix-turn-helix transcriptional regulator [Clostridium botulinum]|uniref:helix-turn-helix transcriptional regulator n=1 Tax=Clostridium botulinum TaxID=1491 RepID=UPI0007731406|nr:helix-turn-helix transcriptional regulator [Clostridium botulinum]
MQNNIKRLLELKGKSVSDLIKETELSRSFIYDVINGNSVPTVKTARKIADYLDTTIDEVFPSGKKLNEKEKIENILKLSL